ncbi:transposase family protein [Streptomyces sp. NPDC007896]|uniref:transposase family protein n=1 Tax=Streptomyces sp. NPDC007896 TaxID=3364784 RepID=UPI0036EB9D02
MSSSLTGVLQRHREDVDLSCPPAELPDLTSLSTVLDRLPDPRRVRGRRYRLGSLLALCLLAVLGGATTLAGIARFAIAPPPKCANGSGWTVLRAPPPWAAFCPALTATPLMTP